jgi:hypothetical protein
MIEKIGLKFDSRAQTLRASPLQSRVVDSSWGNSVALAKATILGTKIEGRAFWKGSQASKFRRSCSPLFPPQPGAKSGDVIFFLDL